MPENGIKIDNFEFMESKNILVNQPKIELPIFEKLLSLNLKNQCQIDLFKCEFYAFTDLSNIENRQS
jgi:hypothetical protein